MIRATVGLLWSAWGGHAALVAAVLLALQVHSVYRVPAVVFVTLLPWLGVVITVTTILMLTVKLLPKHTGRRVRGVPGRVERRIVWVVAIIVITMLAAAFTGRLSLVAAFIGIGVAAAMVAVVAITGRLFAEGSVAFAVRSLYRTALIGIGVFLLWTTVVLVNGALDRSPGDERAAEVLSVVTAAIDPGVGAVIPHAHVDLSSWRTRGGIERLVLSARERQRTWVGQPVSVTVRAGFLNIPWVAAVTMDEARHLNQVLGVSPHASHALQRLIEIHIERRQWDEALELTRRYVAVYPDDVGLVEYVAGYLGVAGRYREQVELIERLVARNPDYKALTMLGFALDRSGDHERAIEVLKRAVKLRPDVFPALHYLGEAYQALERRDDAIAAYEAELRIRPQSLEVQRRIRALRGAGS
jgi:Anaphase-promoting complex, cyclosome, subunit 3